MSSPAGTLIVVRHGQSLWNRDDLFTGWWDCDLSDQGCDQARRGGGLVRAEGISFSCAYSSMLTRAIRTLWLMLDEMREVWLPVHCDYRLNERHYGALTGLNKTNTAAIHGADQLARWRRSYTTRPPPMQSGSPYDVSTDRRYSDIVVPVAESLHDTLERVVSFFNQRIAGRLGKGENILIVAHGNSLRALIKHVFEVDDATISTVEIPVGSPLLIGFSGDSTARSARYLDPQRSAPLPV